MHDRDLYAQILGLQSPWKVVDVQLSVKGEEVKVFVEAAPGSAMKCPDCGAASPGTATVAETRDLLRALVQEVVLDPEKGEGTITFHAIPKMPAEAGGPRCRPDGLRSCAAPSSPTESTNEERTRRSPDMSSHYQMAGARLVGRKRTCVTG